jgi:KaiC/GvpD/RAD55 family RecA-like ATPase
MIAGPVPDGSFILAEYDPESMWYIASSAIATKWLRGGGRLLFCCASQPTDRIRSQLKRLGLDPEQDERQLRLQFWDFYTASTGLKSSEKYAFDSLKVADLSIFFSKLLTSPIVRPLNPEWLRVFDDFSFLDRFNAERSWVELILSRIIPTAYTWRSTIVAGILRGVHSEWAYKRLEAAADGVVDFKVDETNGRTRDLVRVRQMRNAGFDRQWHELKVNENLEIQLA